MGSDDLDLNALDPVTKQAIIELLKGPNGSRSGSYVVHVHGGQIASLHPVGPKMVFSQQRVVTIQPEPPRKSRNR